MQRGGGAPTANVPQARKGTVIYAFVDALINVDTEAITITSVRPNRVDVGLTFDRTVVDTSGGPTLVTWSGTATQATDLDRAHQYQPAEGLTVGPGETQARLQMRYTLTADSNYPYTTDDVRVEYREGGDSCVEVLHQHVAVYRTPPPLPTL